MATDFSKLLSKNTTDVKKPPVLPPGTYFGLITGRVLGESKNKKTPQVEFPCQLTRAGEDVDLSLLENIDISKKKFQGANNRGGTFYFTEDSEYRLVEFAKTFGQVTDGLSLAEIIEIPPGKEVMVTITQGISEKTNEPFNTLEVMKGTGA